MAETNSLLVKLSRDYPKFTFQESEDFYWSYSKKTVYYADMGADFAEATLLHETAHGLLDHSGYDRDIKLVKMEREAWEHARNTLAPRYGIDINPETIEDMLDSYRDWLHARSTCPHCSMTGLQTDEQTYRCLGCDKAWRVNEARRCGLKRTSL